MGRTLDGVRIFDFTHVQSGSTCTQWLGWFGADVIKVERAGAGDVTREQPLLRKTGTIVEVDHPVRGEFPKVGNPIKLPDSPTEVRRSPLLGEHTDAVMTEPGHSPQQISALRAAGAI